MQTRLCFNGGEYAPEMALRSDMEQYYKGVAKLENWELSQMGGIKRRRGMRKVMSALGKDSRLIPYVYSFSEGTKLRYMVELGERTVRVLSDAGTVVKTFKSGAGGVPSFKVNPAEVRFEQVKGWLFLTCLDTAPLVLELEDGLEWSLRRWEFEQVPWHTEELRDTWLEVERVGSNYNVTFDENEADNAEGLKLADYLRASVWTDEVEVVGVAEDILQGVIGPLPGLSAFKEAGCSKGTKFALGTSGAPLKQLWICKQEFDADVFVTGLDDPSCYPDNFERAMSADGFDSVEAKYSVKDFITGDIMPVGTPVAIVSDYWTYWTCVRDGFVYEDGKDRPEDYPGYFMRGVMVGSAVPCRGPWSFNCSGLWYGSYEVRRNYESDLFSDERWECRGRSFSRNEEASNTILSGTENDEVCYLGLFVTRSKRMSDGDLKKGFPSDGCGNRLLVEGCRHDMKLKATPVGSSGVTWSCADKVKLAWSAKIRTQDWSWAAFGAKYGYPMLVGSFQGRLCFAATKSQPQRVWLSRVDDLNNFSSTDDDAGAFTVELNTSTVDPICWLMEQDSRLMLGTTGGEYVLQNGSSDVGAVNAKNVYRARHGRVGSKLMPAWMLGNEVVYVQRGGGRLRVFRYWLETNGYRSEDMSVFAPHILSDHGGCVGVTAMEKPDRVLVLVLGDGQLGLMVYNEFHQVAGWHRWVTDGKVLSACALPAGGGNGDRLWLVVERNTVSAAGVVVSTAVNIEVVDEQSTFEDAGGRSYVSRLKTNDLVPKLEQVVDKRMQRSAKLRLGAPLLVAGLKFRYNDEDGWQVPDCREPVMPAGWMVLRGARNAAEEHVVELMYSGKQGCEIMALQG